MPEAPVLMVGTDVEAVEADLVGGRLGCPWCGGVLGPWGHARWRVLRRREGQRLLRPRRARCRLCRKTHVLLGDCCFLRRRDDAERIVAALTEAAQGVGFRTIAARLGMAEYAFTVRGWLRAFGRAAEVWRSFFTRWAYALDVDLGPIGSRGEAVADAVEAMGVAARAAVQRFGPILVSARVARLSGGALLCHTSCLFRVPPGV